MDFKDFKQNRTKLSDLISLTVPKGKFIHFEAGEGCQSGVIAKGDVLLGVFPKEDQEAIGFYQYKGTGCVMDSDNYINLSDQITKQ